MLSSSNNLSVINYYSMLGLSNDTISVINAAEIFKLIIEKKTTIEVYEKDQSVKYQRLLELNTCDTVFRYSRTEYDRKLLIYLESLIPKPKAEELIKQENERLYNILNNDPKFSDDNLLEWFHAICKEGAETKKREKSSNYCPSISLYHPFFQYCNNAKIEDLVRAKLRGLILGNKLRMKTLLLSFKIPELSYDFEEVLRALIQIFYEHDMRTQHESDCKRQFLELVLSDNALTDLFLESVLVENQFISYCNSKLRYYNSQPKRYIKGIYNFSDLLDKTIQLFNLNNAPNLLGDALATLFNSQKFVEGVVNYSQYMNNPTEYFTETCQLEVESLFLGGIFDDEDEPTVYTTANVSVTYIAPKLSSFFNLLTSKISNCSVDIIGERILETPELFQKVVFDDSFWKNFSPKLQSCRDQKYKKYLVEQADKVVNTYVEKIKISAAKKKKISLFFRPVEDMMSAALYLNLLEYLKNSPIQHGIIICAILSNDKLKALKSDMEKSFNLETIIHYIYQKLKSIHGDTILYDCNQLFTEIIEPINKLVKKSLSDKSSNKKNFLEIFKNELDKMHVLRGEELQVISGNLIRPNI